jgi:hypothetical protein
MRKLYDELIAKGEAGIEDLLGRQETVDLEFKTKEKRSTGEASPGDRRQLGKILSAFSNSAGGLFVWGVDARKNADDIDCAAELQPIAEIERFKNWVLRTTGEVLMPHHDGVSIEAIPSAVQAGAGYIVAHVQRSERRPHRSEVKGDKQYYKRSGDSSFAMEHYDIEDSFKRFTVPSLQLQSKAFNGGSISTADSGRVVYIHSALSLYNPTSTTARHPYLIVELRPRFSVVGRFGIPEYPDGDRLAFEGGADHVINPERSRSFVLLGAGFSEVDPENGTG